MSRHGAVELDWADGTYTFRLSIAGIEELEAKWSREAERDVSLFSVVTILAPAVRTARLAHIREVLRVGLIGGGMSPVDALAKVRLYIDQRPLDENRDTAYAVALAGLQRVHSKDLEEPPSGEALAATSDASTSPLSEEAPD
ncbi:gene transfer agent family protein [Neoaquamicrobium sediminum]|mgnify:CR=1 FL=1|uniref:TAC11 family tail assembly protein n=2 Tax=root TaxID=1 RepID=A0AB38ZLI5_9VIRU